METTFYFSKQGLLGFWITRVPHRRDKWSASRSI